jgi:hypothetical protein
MPSRKRRDDNPPRDNDRDREPYVEEGFAVQVHQAYLEHRLSGGEEPDPEAYRRAAGQFQQLPGAVGGAPRRPVQPPRREPSDAEDNELGNGESTEDSGT